MANEYYNLNVSSDLGQAGLSLGSIEDIARISALKINGVFPTKKESDMVNVKVKEDKLIIELSLKLLQNIDIANTCTSVQKKIYNNILEMAGVKCDSINIDVTGFVKEKEDK